MNGRRIPPGHLRLVVSTANDDRPVVITAPGNSPVTELDRALAPYVEAGRKIVAAGVAAVIDAAAENGLDWDRDCLRIGITDIVTRELHDDIADYLTRHGVDHDTAARHLANRYGRDG